MALIDKEYVGGLDTVLRTLQSRVERLKEGYVRGLKRAGLLLQRESQKIVPVDTGNLKASAFTRLEGSGWKAAAIVGYTAIYAVWVHEAVGMRLKGIPRQGEGHGGRYWDPQGRAQAKFLEVPFRQLRDQFRAILVEEMKK